MLDLVDQALDKVPLFAHMPVIIALSFAIRARRGDRLHPSAFDLMDQLGVVVAFVCQQRLRLAARNQGFGLWAVVTRARRQNGAQRITECINSDMDLGRETAARAS